MLPHLVVLSSLKGLTSHIPQRSPNLRHSLDMHTQQPTSLGGLTRIAHSKSRYSLEPSRPPLCKWHIYPSNSPAQKLHGHPLAPVPHLSVNPTGLSERPEHGHPSRWPRLPPSPSVTFQTMTATASCVLPDPTLASSTFPVEPPLQSQNVHLTSLLGSKPSDASPKCRIKAKIRRTSPKALPRLASLPSPSICSPAAHPLLPRSAPASPASSLLQGVRHFPVSGARTRSSLCQDHSSARQLQRSLGSFPGHPT